MPHAWVARRGGASVPTEWDARFDDPSRLRGSRRRGRNFGWLAERTRDPVL